MFLRAKAFPITIPLFPSIVDPKIVLSIATRAVSAPGVDAPDCGSSIVTEGEWKGPGPSAGMICGWVLNEYGALMCFDVLSNKRADLSKSYAVEERCVMKVRFVFHVRIILTFYLGASLARTTRMGRCDGGCDDHRFRSSATRPHLDVG